MAELQIVDLLSPRPVRVRLLLKECDEPRDYLPRCLVDEPMSGPCDDHAVDIVGDQASLRDEKIAAGFLAAQH